MWKRYEPSKGVEGRVCREWPRKTVLVAQGSRESEWSGDTKGRATPTCGRVWGVSDVELWNAGAGEQQEVGGEHGRAHVGMKAGGAFPPAAVEAEDPFQE